MQATRNGQSRPLIQEQDQPAWSHTTYLLR